METDLNIRVLKCFDAGLDTLGSASKIVYGYLLRKSGLKRDDIPDDPGDFMQALRTLFGQGAGMLEMSIVRELKQAFDLTGENQGLADVLSVVRDKVRSKPQPDELASSRIHTNHAGPSKVRHRQSG